MFFSPEQIEQLDQGYLEVHAKYNAVLLKSSLVSAKLSNDRAKEFLMHGFGRRLKILKRCIENVYTLFPPDTKELLSSENLSDLDINLQSFILNVFGCFDNMAWVLVREKKLNINRRDVSFLKDKINPEIMSALSDDLQKYILSDKNKEWISYLKNFRDALAHRIPLYVPPKGLIPEEQREYERLENLKTIALVQNDYMEHERLNDKQDSLGSPLFVMCHSFSETDSKHMVFHVQMLADFNTVCEFAEKFFAQLLGVDNMLKAQSLS